MKNGIEKILEIEREARKIIEDAQNKAESIRKDAEKEAEKIVMEAKKEANSIIAGYKSQISTTLKKEEKEVKEKKMNLNNNWIKKYEKLREELLKELITSSLGRK